MTDTDLKELPSALGDLSWTHEGCDQCGHSSTTAYVAQAWLRFTLPSGSTLVLCAHHGNAAKPKMALLGATVEDLSGRINAKPESSAF
jgi:hypothetical protein